MLIPGACDACAGGSVLEAQGPYHGQLTDNVFEERLQDYRVQRSIQYVQQLDSRWRIMYTRRQPGGTGFDDAVFFEPMRSSSVCEDEQTSPLYAPPLLSYAATGFLKYKQGMCCTFLHAAHCFYLHFVPADDYNTALGNRCVQAWHHCGCTC